MSEQMERRKHFRSRLRLRISRLEGLTGLTSGDLWTSDVSAGGMYFCAHLAGRPRPGEDVAFELAVPPGEGYSSSSGRIRGTGKVIRSIPVGEAGMGVAVQFTRSLALQF